MRVCGARMVYASKLRPEEGCMDEYRRKMRYVQLRLRGIPTPNAPELYDGNEGNFVPDLYKKTVA